MFLLKILKKKKGRKKKKKKPWALWTGLHKPNPKIY